MAVKIGDRVGGHRWPLSSAHPGCWGRPWSGVVLAQNDVRAWTNTLAFSGTPSQPEVDAHVVHCHAQELLPDTHVPVLWDFGTTLRVWWEDTPFLRPYTQDVQEWRVERRRALERCKKSPQTVLA